MTHQTQQVTSSSERDQITANLFRMQKSELLTICAGLQIKHNTYDDRQTLVKKVLAKAGYIKHTSDTTKIEVPLTEAELTSALMEYIRLEIGLLQSGAQMLQMILDSYPNHKSALRLAREARHELNAYRGHTNLGKIAGYLTSKGN